MNILQLTNYPTVNPMHGGQIRASQIVKSLQEAGHQVSTFAVYIGAHFTDAQPGDLALELDPEYFNERLAFISDYMTGVYLQEKAEPAALASARIRDFKPDVVIVEHPWLFDFVKAAVPEATRLVYSSHNIEWRLKNVHVDGESDAHLDHVDAIRSAETRAALRADMVVACTQADAVDLGLLSDGRQRNIVVCGNGVEPFTCKASDVSRWRHFFEDAIGAPYPVFVSSAHPPNAAGFWSLLAPGLTFLRPTEEIVVIGGVCSLITKAAGIDEYRELNLDRLHLLGTRSKIELQAIVRASHVVLLPIATGEGSNLKTAEALESGCPIVATTRALRGYADAADLPHVHVADTATDFRRAVRKVLNDPRRDGLTPASVRSRYYWSTQLQPLIRAIGEWSEHGSAGAGERM